MKIDSQNLEAMILHGARVAYEVNNPPSWDQPFEQWLAGSQQITEATGRSHISEQLGEWCRRVCDGETTPHFADLPLDAQKAIIVARRAFAAVEALDRTAMAALPVT